MYEEESEDNKDLNEALKHAANFMMHPDEAALCRLLLQITRAFATNRLIIHWNPENDHPHR